MPKVFSPVQKQIMAFLKGAGCFALVFVKMRLGKTLPMIRFVNFHLKPDLVLVVAPGSAFLGWKVKLAEEGHGVKFLIGTPKQRLKELKDDSRWYLVNYDAWDVVGKHLIRIPWDVIILDESHMVKNWKAKRTQFWVKQFQWVRYRFCMTGTHDPEGFEDWFPQLYFASPRILGFRNYFNWLEKCFMEFGFERRIHPQYLKLFQKKVAPHCIIIDENDAGFQDVVDEDIITISMGKEQAERYGKLEKAFILELPGKEISTIHQMVAYQWLRSMASGFVHLKEEFLDSWELVWDGKVDALMDLLKVYPSPVLVWCSFVAEAVKLKEVFDLLASDAWGVEPLKGKVAEVIHGGVPLKKRIRIQEDFQAGRIHYLFMQPDSMKTGADLWMAPTTIFFSLPLSGEAFEQAQKRMVNYFITMKKTLIYLVTEGTLEEEILQGLKGKLKRSAMNSQTIKAIQERNL